MQQLPRRGRRDGDPRGEVLELNRKLRNEELSTTTRGLDFGYVALQIPVQDMRVLQILFPDLASLDPDIQHRAWQKFMADPRSAPYKIRKNDGRRLRATA